MREFSLVIPPELDGVKVDTALRRGLQLSATRIRRAKFREDGIALDGVRVFTSAIVHTGQHLVLRLPEEEETPLVPTPGPVSILYEDEWLLAVDKAPGVPVHPSPGHYADTLGNHLAWLYRQRGEKLAFHPVNRLDKGTSGVMILAKRAEVHERLQSQLHTPGFVREYCALTRCAPAPPSGVVDAPIGLVEGTLNRHWVLPEGKRAVTQYETIAQREDSALIRLRLDTGRTHQIRVHLAWLGVPLLGDTFYGGDPALDRPALHARRVLLKHPCTGERLTLTAPAPQDFERLGWGDLP